MSGDVDESGRTMFRATPLQELRATRAAGSTHFSGDPAASPIPRGSAGPHAEPIDEDFPDAGVARHPRNPLVEAAAPLLTLISAVRSRRLEIALPDLHRRATAAAARFDEEIVRFRLDPESQRRARYAVYATVDDVAQTLPGRAGEGAEWARRSMVVRGFGENIGGDRFWMLLAEMLKHPAGNTDLIELYHACLAAGFQGRHRISDNGDGQIRRVMTDAYAALPHVRTLSGTELVRDWRGTPTPRDRVGPWAPLLLAGSIAAGLLLLVLLILRLVLAQTGEPAMAAMAAIDPEAPLRLARPAEAPPPPDDAQKSRIAGFLAPEIAQHLVTVDEDASTLRVRTTVGQLFRSGSDTLEPGRQALFERIARAVEAEKGPVRIEGHADSDPVASLTFPNNLALSEARARTVAAIFRTVLSDPGRVSAEGYGATRPIAANATAAGKSLNRRVEIIIPRAGVTL